MVKAVLLRALLTAALSVTLAGAALGQDDDLTPRSINALALQFEIQQAQIDRLDDRIDNIRVGTLRDRLRTLEAAVAELSGQFAASPFSIVAGERPQDVPTQEVSE